MRLLDASINCWYSFRLNDNITIFTGEMMAIKMALLWLKDSYETGEDKQTVAIFSDLFPS